MENLMENFKYGTHFIYNGKEYCVVGDDSGRNEIECISVPQDDRYYWFEVIDKNKVRLI